jgi:murein DD-endopeptidase MepM/ murein hydrolase activator NlpD
VASVLRRRGANRRVRGALAVVAAVVGFPLLAGSTAHAAVLPSLSAIPLPSLTPTALPTLPLPTGLPTLPLPTIPLPSSTLGGLLPPPPTALPGLPTTPAAGLPGTGLPQPFLPPGSPWVPGSAAGDASGAGQNQVETSVLGALLGLLGTPASVGVEQPSLEHFDVDASLAAGRVAPGNHSGAQRTGQYPAFLWGVTILGLLVLMAFGMVRQHRRRLGRLRAVAAAPLIVLAGVMTVAAAQGTWFPATPANTSATIGLANLGSHSTPTAAAVQTTGAALFDRVVGFETQIARTEAELGSPSAVPGAALLREEQRLALSLEATLQQEYGFFVSTARDPAQAAALVQASANKPAKVRNAVTYDVEAVQAQLAQQAAIALAAQNNYVSGATTPAAPGAATPPAAHPGLLTWPMSGVITQRFGASGIAIEPAVTLAGITYPHFHTGIDIASSFETPVRAAADGVVALAGAETDGLGHLVGFGNYVVIAHGWDMVTLYGHLQQVLVRPGQAVHVGDPVGLEGSTGNSTGPHVHFELRIHGTPTDPTAYVAPR